jgi:hypothetical protein
MEVTNQTCLRPYKIMYSKMTAFCIEIVQNSLGKLIQTFEKKKRK